MRHSSVSTWLSVSVTAVVNHTPTAETHAVSTVSILKHVLWALAAWMFSSLPCRVCPVGYMLFMAVPSHSSSDGIHLPQTVPPFLVFRNWRRSDILRTGRKL
ncbi:hypothetical protein EDD15DRAFT_2323102 [Pisolithus albus]|nr:hypothetical protein EDD15DRAFT_2323102 [Pisolithus albus]